ncbi:MAG: hypothetical protein ACREJ3_00225, partial [Polyangiaceae bacterium]
MTTKELSELETAAGGVIDEADLAEDEAEDADDMASLDRLVAETDQGWDADEQARTLKDAASMAPAPGERARVESIAPRPRKGPPPLPGLSAATPAASRTPDPLPVRAALDVSHSGALIDVLQARVASLEAGSDKVGIARAHIELAIVSETVLGDDGRAATHAQAALKADPTSAAAHALLRRLQHGRSALPAMLVHVEHEIASATTGAHNVELLAVKARLLEALGGHSSDVVVTWEKVLAHAPNHPAALKGLESELANRALASGARPSDWEALATHLVHMAEAYETETRLAAWLHVERAQILERHCGHVDAARAALERAVKLDPGVGPVRDALVRHASSHSDWSSLVRLLDEEALVEPSPARAARLELDAATIAALRLEDRPRACALLQRAAARAPTVKSVDLRVLDELVRHAEHDAQRADAMRARKARLELLTLPAAIAHELRVLAAAAESDGDVQAATEYVNRALEIEPGDALLIEALDRLLAASGKHDQRMATWLHEAARAGGATARVRAFVRAAQIARELGRGADAVRHLRSAWVVLPGDAQVLDALALQLSPVMSEAGSAEARSLVDLYAQASDCAKEAGRKAAYLEKAALLWEDVLGDPVRAARAYERVLAIDKDRI